MEHASKDEISRHVKIYIAVFVTLGFLTIVTVLVSYMRLPIHKAIAIALVIASVKASLVAAFFMHLVSEKKIIFAILTLTFIFFIVLLIIPSH